MTCDNCGLETPTKNAILQGTFGAYCSQCLRGTKRLSNTGYASYHRSREREDHQRDTIQPRDFNGKPNREFIHAYPEESQSMFTPKELKENE